MPNWIPYLVEPMSSNDIEHVLEIERVAFSHPWSARAYRYEITENEHSTMLVARLAPTSSGGPVRLARRLGLARPGLLLGYAGCWLLVDEIHISTIAVHPRWRRRGVGEFLLLALLDRGAELGARRATLEVRVSNLAAQELYLKYGFEVVSRRRRYYADNDEDAYIMATPEFEEPEFGQALRQRRRQLYERLETESVSLTRALHGEFESYGDQQSD